MKMNDLIVSCFNKNLFCNCIIYAISGCLNLNVVLRLQLEYNVTVNQKGFENRNCSGLFNSK